MQFEGTGEIFWFEVSMKVIFHENQLCYRGTSIALFDYAFYNQKILSNSSVVMYQKNNPNNDSDAIRRFSEHFEVIAYSDFKERQEIVDHLKADFYYAINSGQKEELPVGIETGVHAVFKYFEPYGDVYAYVSKWLADTMSDGKIPYVPHMIDLPDVSGDLRDELNIPKDAIVFARYGGAETFDIGFVQDTVKKISRKNKNIYFLFMGTNNFVKRNFIRPYKNVIFLPSTVDVCRKVKFISTSDAFLHARMQGESFGIAVGEFSSKNKPVITFGKSDEKSHLDILGSKAIVYNDEKELENILNTFKPNPSANWDCYSQQFSAENVMRKFDEVFLQKR